MTRVVVAGALANRPWNGGGAAVRVEWVEGLRRLGCEVWFVEQIARARATGGGRERRGDGDDGGPVDFFAAVCERAGLAGRAALVDERGASLAGVSARVLAAAAEAADLLVNLGGHLRLDDLRRRFRRRAFVDLDPGFTQIWHETGADGGALAGHDRYFSVGLNVGRAECGVPTAGVRWQTLVPPVILDEWPAAGGGLTAFTTVASWRGPFGRLEHGGRSYGSKAHELRKLLDLPAHLDAPVEIALAIEPGDGRDLAALRAHGWRVVDPRRRVPDPDAYRRYVLGSGAELSVAQPVYVETRSGWLSDRTVRYLAAGKPALVQDTGLGAALPVGEGLVPFRDRREAIAGATAIARDYGGHSAAARALAEREFDSDRVLARFLDQALGPSP